MFLKSFTWHVPLVVAFLIVLVAKHPSTEGHDGILVAGIVAITVSLLYIGFWVAQLRKDS